MWASYNRGWRLIGDDHHIDPPLPDVGKQFLQRRLLHRAAGKAAIIIAVTAQFLSLMRLAFDVGLRGLERVEILLKPLVTRDPGVDRAAQGGPDHEGSGKVSSNSESFASKTTGRQKSGICSRRMNRVMFPSVSLH